MSTSSLLRTRLLSAVRRTRPYSSAPAPARTIRASHTLAATLVASLSAYALGAFFPPDLATLISPRAAPRAPDADTPDARADADKLEAALTTLPLLEHARAAPDAGEWYETRPYTRYPPERAAQSLTAGALRGPGRLALSPLVRARRDESASIVVVHVGRGVCGHDGIVHGGLLATLCDEALGRTAILNLPEKVGVTANLTMDYKAPTRADQFIVIRTQLIEVKGRKAIVSGRLEDARGMLLAEARATFVQPRYAKLLNTAALRQVLGEPEDSPLLPAANATAPVAPAVPEGAKRAP